jgi:chromosomal replication initiator protein
VVETGVLDLGELWIRVLDDLEHRLPGAAQRTWLQETRPVGFNDDTVVLAAPHSFAREQLDTRFGPELRGALARVAGRALNVVVTVAPEMAAAEPLPDTAEVEEPAGGGGGGGPPPPPHQTPPPPPPTTHN